MPKPVGFLIPIFIAAGLGPLIAGLAVSISAFGTNIFDTNIFDNTNSLLVADLFKMSGFYIAFAYY